ncbi:MAG: 3-deoxy-manno-octulosonate cytidylyltransferase [Melioribacteraceae bacterium]|nr:3-deoxy-manno-octulosonate cytidylyltransferase [Melioribacteraceae bacterium]MCF8355114.1 3-deoxy-manno-octulosonate cytidylyltransferase [Melioribacteraceae bacterium]MCF8392409.1 3-deoxy-manno-octulosonate cytidylyltransferase [Melioribacteraceae bacterium]MCF8417930.1 3-deoxy-manno-octulosonate cytidylyltransferase [Melioribacteraceae bacterium]
MIIGIIPARFASTRLMGKPLADIDGKPMIQHTYESAKKSKLLDDIIIAVDDQKLYDVVKSFGARVKMTPKEIETGSDRIAYVVDSLPGADLIVNIQGDEPFIKGKMIDQAIEPFLFDKEIEVSTLAKKIDNVDDLKSTSIPKVVFDYNNFALYFSRTPIPFVRDASTLFDRLLLTDFYKHIGLYVYKRDILLKFSATRPTDLEKAEKLEQLRFLENGVNIKVVVTELESFSVDTQTDLENARKFYHEKIKKRKKND